MNSLIQFACTVSISSSALATPWVGGEEHSIPISGGGADLSGATWNPSSQSLWVVRQNRQIWEFAYETDNFQLQQTLMLPSAIGSDIEACAQVNQWDTEELYTLAENEGRLARIADVGGTPTVLCSWNLQGTNNGNNMPPETNGLGAEGLEFVPDANLLSAGFRFPDGTPFNGSAKGMGGLIFVGHQLGGRLHVFDINPDVPQDFINHGSFTTSETEIAGLHFDRTNGLMHVWHNTSSGNVMSISSLSSDDSIGTIDTIERYDSDMPSGNLEGITIVNLESCGEFGSEELERVIFLTRDGGSPNLIYFNAFPCTQPGACCDVGACEIVTEAVCMNLGGQWLGGGSTCESCASSCSGDTNADYAVDILDLLYVIAVWGTDNPAGDINEDGIVDVSDLLEVIGNWGPCP